MKETFKAGAAYFALVLAAGFVLGTIRTLCIVPRWGVRMAELAEAPIIFCISIVAARWVMRHVQVSALRSRRLAVGCIYDNAMGLLRPLEFAPGLDFPFVQDFLHLHICMMTRRLLFMFTGVDPIWRILSGGRQRRSLHALPRLDARPKSSREKGETGD